VQCRQRQVVCGPGCAAASTPTASAAQAYATACSPDHAIITAHQTMLLLQFISAAHADPAIITKRGTGPAAPGSESKAPTSHPNRPVAISRDSSGALVSVRQVAASSRRGSSLHKWRRPWSALSGAPQQYAPPGPGEPTSNQQVLQDSCAEPPVVFSQFWRPRGRAANSFDKFQNNPPPCSETSLGIPYPPWSYCPGFLARLTLLA
jgi:hypothetical protein